MATDASPEMDPSRLVFVGGLHRSGTTLVGRIPADHESVSGFENTGATEDEGQHLQTVYRPAKSYGGPGRFAFDPRAHLTEVSPDQAAQLGSRLLGEWARYWDLTRPVLVEKSPPNLIMGRWLQSLFPGSKLVVVVRHPVVVALSTKKWRRRTSLVRLVRHWFTAHDILARDAPHLSQLHLLRYEDLLAEPESELGRLQHSLGLHPGLGARRLDKGRSNPYIDTWKRMANGGMASAHQRRSIHQEFGHRFGSYGYDFDDLEKTLPWKPRWTEEAGRTDLTD